MGRKGSFQQLIRNRDGAAALEFALVMIPFLALTLAIIETTVMAFTDAVLQNAVTEAARMVRTGQSSVTGGGGASAFSTAVCNQLNGLVDCANLVFDLRSFTSFSAISIPVPDANGGTAGAVYNTGASSATASTSVADTSSLVSAFASASAVTCASDVAWASTPS